jgi:putative membrane protein
MATDASASTKLAIDRTRLAYERTLMAWVRTATSLISFGFTIFKFFQFLREGQPTPQEGMIGLRTFAVLMIGIGLNGVVAGFGRSSAASTPAPGRIRANALLAGEHRRRPDRRARVLGLLSVLLRV